MSMVKCINKVFKEPLTERGFKKSGTLYYRLKGTCLQAIMIDQINPFIIRIDSHPYWMHTIRSSYIGTSLDRIMGGSWMSGPTIGGVYYKKDTEEEFEGVLSKYLEKVIDVIIPYLDSRYDEMSVLETSLDKFFNKEIIEPLFKLGDEWCPLINSTVNLFWTDSDGIGQYLFLYKAWKEKSFEESSEIVNRIIDKEIGIKRDELIREKHARATLTEKMKEEIKEHAELMLAVCPKDYTPELAYEEAYRIWGPREVDVESELEKTRSGIIKPYEVFLKAAAENDFSTFEKIYEEQCAIMKDVLNKKMKLIVE